MDMTEQFIFAKGNDFSKAIPLDDIIDYGKESYESIIPVYTYSGNTTSTDLIALNNTLAVIDARDGSISGGNGNPIEIVAYGEYICGHCTYSMDFDTISSADLANAWSLDLDLTITCEANTYVSVCFYIGESLIAKNDIRWNALVDQAYIAANDTIHIDDELTLRADSIRPTDTLYVKIINKNAYQYGNVPITITISGMTLKTKNRALNSLIQIF
jgi:hypothetical protein